MKKLIQFSVLFMLLLSACTKDNDPVKEVIPSDLFGRWEFELPGGVEGAPDQLFVLIFEEQTDRLGNYEIQWNVRDEQGTYFLVGGQKGEFTVRGELMFMDTEFVGTQWDPDNEKVLDEIVWYDRNDPFFDVFGKTTELKFRVTGQGLEITEDEDGNGKYDEEVVLYTRK